jgi:hypothetical protein
MHGGTSPGAPDESWARDQPSECKATLGFCSQLSCARPAWNSALKNATSTIISQILISMFNHPLPVSRAHYKHAAGGANVMWLTGTCLQQSPVDMRLGSQREPCRGWRQRGPDVFATRLPTPDSPSGGFSFGSLALKSQTPFTR